MKNIIDTYKNRIKSIIKNITGTYNEDLEQEVYVRTWKNLDKYKEQNKFQSWISVITANLCRDYLKSSHNIKQKKIESEEFNENIISEKFNPVEEFERKSRRKKIAKAIISLPKKNQEVLVMYEIEDLDYFEISKKLKCPIGTVKSRLYNARKQLNEILKEEIDI